MAMTVQQMRDSINNMCELDKEMGLIYHYLDDVLDWPVDRTFEQMVKFDELKKRMGEEVTHFSFVKKDGSLRQAYGTRLSEVIVRHEGAALPPDGQRHKSGSTFSYFDIERQAWRCFKVESLIDIERGYSL